MEVPGVASKSYYTSSPERKHLALELCPYRTLVVSVLLLLLLTSTALERWKRGAKWGMEFHTAGGGNEG